MTEQHSQEFRIPEQNYSGLILAIQKLNKQAKKLKCMAIQLEELGYEEERTYDEESGYERLRLFVRCRITGEAPRVAGWTFVASADLDGDGLCIVRAVPGTVTEGELVRFRESTNWCDHCRQKRPRNSVYILRHDDMTTYKQVGSKCLVDFLGHKNPMAIANIAEMFFDAVDLCTSAEEGSLEGGSRSYLLLEEYLTWVAGCIRCFGWLAKGKAENEGGNPTASRALMAMEGKQKEYSPTKEDKEKAIAAIAWIREQTAFVESGSDYQSNLYVTCRKDVIAYRQSGLAASLISAYQKTIDDAFEQKQRKASQFQGDLGQKITRIVTCNKVTSYESYYGIGYILMMIDQDGNRYKWFTKYASMDEGVVYTITGTVKGHDDSFNRIAYTIITRCKVSEYLTQKAG